MASCPATSHGQGNGDRNPSLHVTYRDGTVLLECFAGCATIDVLTALGLDYADLWDEPLQEDRLVDSWIYRKTNGEPLVTKERWHRPGGHKRFVVRSAETGEVGLPIGVPKPLYGLPSLAERVRAHGTVYVVEGEKCVAAAQRLGLTATCSLNGAADWLSHYWTWLNGAGEVIVVVDNDEPGYTFGAKVIADLRNHSIRCRALKVALTQPKADLWDHVQAGYGVADLLPVNLNKASPDIPAWSGLLAMVFEPIRWVVDDLIPRGSFSLLAGAPKIGKSWVALDLACGVARGGMAMQQLVCQQGAVLYLSVDNDSYQNLQERTTAIVGNSSADMPLFPMVDWTVGEEAVLWCREWIEEVQNGGLNPALIVVDTMIKVEPNMEGDGKGSAYAASYASLSRWANLATSTGVAVLAVHHDRKGNAEGDWVNRFLGSRGLSAAAHNLMLLDCERGKPNGWLRAVGRNIQDENLELVRTGRTWSTFDQPGRSHFGS
jgi:hypothetical protein